MNIQALELFNIYSNSGLQNKSAVQNFYVSNYGLKLASQPATDTVSFTGRPKSKQTQKKIREVITEQCTRKDLQANPNYSELPQDVVINIHKIAANAQIRINKYIHNLLDDLCMPDENYEEVISKITLRAKLPGSIREKALQNEWYTKDAILRNMTDLNGCKLVLRGGNRKGVDIIIERLTEEIKAGRLELLEVENKRPEITKILTKKKNLKANESKEYCASKLDYATPELLGEMVDAMHEKHPRQIVEYKAVQYTKSNYPALHFLLRLPQMERGFELQIMGSDVAKYKDLDDVLYKILNNKKPNDKYHKITKIVSQLNKPENAKIKEGFDKYRAKVFYDQRNKDPRLRGTAKYTEDFTHITNEIKDPYFKEVLDANYLYKLYLDANAKIKK